MDSFESVEVQSAVTGVWTPGFLVVGSERSESGEKLVRLRRQSDGSMLPVPVSARRVRPASHSAGATGSATGEPGRHGDPQTRPGDGLDDDELMVALLTSSRRAFSGFANLAALTPGVPGPATDWSRYGGTK